MVFISLEAPLLLYMALQMQIGLVVLMIASLRVAILSFLVRHRFLGNPASNAQLLAPLLRLSIKLLLMVLLKSFGFNTF
jgi:cytochrome b561